jgi:hypothetical protein
LRVLTVLFTIDEVNPDFYLSLKELGSKQFTPEILAYLAAEAQYLTRPYESAIMVSFYRNEHLINPTPLTINRELELRGTGGINLRHQHHVRISLVQDLHLLRNGAIERLREHGRAAIQILDALDPSLRKRGFLPAIIGDNYITKTGMLLAIENMLPSKRLPGQYVYNATVQTLIVSTGPHL